MNKSKSIIDLWSFTIALVVVLFSTCVVNASIDYNPPAWRNNAGSTLQMWAFSDNANPSIPDLDDNDYGVASLEIIGSSLWKASDLGHSGVWKVEDAIEIDIPNTPNQTNPYKDIWLQMTFYASGGFLPDVEIFEVAGSPVSVFMTEVPGMTSPDGSYWEATFQGRLSPNPTSEKIRITPRDCTIYIDDIVIDTICVPEPMTLLLLGTGSLALLRKRR